MAGTKTLLMLENFIDGKFLPCNSYTDSYDPSTGEVYWRVPNSGTDEMEVAVEAALAAFPAWSSRSPQERSRVLHRLVDLLEQSLEELTQAESKHQGKTITLARTMDIPRSVQNFWFFSSSTLHHTSQCTQMDHLGCLHYTFWAPVGIEYKLKEKENGTFYHFDYLNALEMVLSRHYEKFKHPPEKCSTRCGKYCVRNRARVGEALVSHPDVPLISFTGSQPTAEWIIQLSAPHCKKLSLELGGKNPAIIFEDAHLEEYVPTTVRSSFINQIRSYIKKARTEGAHILCGEGMDKLSVPPRNQAGYFMLPTVITDSKDESCCMKEEIFGPVTCVIPFDSEDEVIKRANSVNNGLAATVWSSNMGRVHRVARKLQSGLVWTSCWLIRELNLPFGGMNSSGVGREGAKASHEFFTEIKTVTIKH